MKRIISLIVAMLPIALLAACATNGEKPANLATEPTTSEAATESVATVETSGAQEPARMESDSMKDSTSLLDKRVIYFAFDKSDINSEDLPVIQAHAQYLANHPSVHVRLEGFADERGTREYNMALGERRDHSVLEFFALQGVAADRIETVSYGEEHPVALGHNESSWSQNRRVEIVYPNQDSLSLSSN